ncbi:MAG: ATP-binding protein [Selenomonadaceae bacterium]|nr:ATP-binding protein [Selenomonadaceae bacterium]
MPDKKMLGIFPRESYVSTLRKLAELNRITLLTGVRGSGKTALLSLLAERLKAEGLSSEQLISLNFDDLRFGERLDSEAIRYYMEENLREGLDTYLFLDELNSGATFEALVGRLYLNRRLHIYIATSQSSILTGDLSTVLSGGYSEVAALPLSLSEFRRAMTDAPHLVETSSEGASAVDSKEEQILAAYLKNGGLPRVAKLTARGENVRDYLEGLFYTILGRDILERYPLRDFALLKEMLATVSFDPTRLVSPGSAAKLLSKEGLRKVSAHTTADYLEALTATHLLYWVPRVDLKTGQTLKTAGKYYPADLGLRNLILPQARLTDAAAMENLVYLELRRQGYHVTLGKLGTATVDFVGSIGERKIYIELATAENLTVKLRPLEQIRDQYPKLVLMLGEPPVSDHQGIRVLGVGEFLDYQTVKQ